MACSSDRFLHWTTIATIVLSIDVVAAAPAWGQGAPPKEQIARAANDLLESLYRRGLFQGAVVMGRDDEELYARGFGYANAEAGVAFGPDTPSDGASIAKTLTAASIYMLHEEGRLDLDAPVQRYLPEYPHAATLVRHLISHTAGLPDYDFFDPFVGEDETRTTAFFLDVLRAREVPPAFAPGTRFEYSSLGFDTAALLVEQVTGAPWEEFLRVRVFEPLGMDDTFLRPAWLKDWASVRTLSYRPDGDSLVVWDIWDNEGFYGGSNLYYSARDLYRWSRSFYARPVLGRTAYAAGIEAPLIEDPATGEGGRSGINLLSWYRSAEGHRHHYPGSLRGFWSYAYRDEDRHEAIAYVSNNAMPQWLRPLLIRALVEILERGEAAPIASPPYLELTEDTASSIAGSYDVPGLGDVVIEESEGKVSLRVNNGLRYRGFFVENGQMYVPGLDVWVGFSGDGPRAIQRLHWISIFAVAEGERSVARSVEVITRDDDGPGSFRAVILEANGDPSIESIRFREGVGRIELASAVVYTGSQSLHIDGQGGTLAGTPACDCDLLVANGGGDLALANLVVEDAPRTGILVVVPAGATGEIEVSLRDVTIRNNGLHGLAIDDQAGDDGTGSDSDAGILIEVTSSVIAGNGFREGFSDYDGIRVDEGGNGGLGARVHGSRFVENAGDGLELDERGPGSAIADVDRSTFVDNGAQPQNPEDLEDGFDIDEADAGDIQVSIEHSTASGNHDEGLDLGEEGPGDLRLGATRFVASGNVDEGIKLLEDVETQAGGDLVVELEYVTASGSQKGSGIQLGEVGPGNLQVEVSQSTVADNASDGVHATQAAPGEGRLQLHDVTVSGNAGEDVATEGVEVITEGR